MEHPASLWKKVSYTQCYPVFIPDFFTRYFSYLTSGYVPFIPTIHSAYYYDEKI